MIRSSGSSLLAILNDVLDFSKIEAGRMELEPSPFALAQVLEAVATIMSVNAGEKNLHLAIGVDAGVPAQLVGDSHRLQQILVNLLGNAIKFTEQGSVVLLVETLHAERQQGGPVSLRFTVRDTGIGIAPERLAQLFAPFSQADASMTRRFGGTGLGLTISRRLADLMGGAIDVRSTLGAGSDFVLTVPLQRGADTEEPGMPRTGSQQALHLLLIGDQGPGAGYLGRTVASCGWTSTPAAGGDHALELLGDPAQHYDAVLLDWNMPGLCGRAILRQLRDDVRLGGRPVIVMVNAYEQGRLLLVENEQDADGVLLKPVTAARLHEALKAALKEAPHHHAVHEPLPAAPVSQEASEQIRLDGAHLLLVEDNPVNQLVARSMLEYAGAHITAVDNGRAAIDALRDSVNGGDHHYDLVLMDVQMPEMDGFTATGLIRTELGLTLPVLAMTAGVMESEREQCIASGMNDFIAKPIDVEQMLAVIRRHLRQDRWATTPTRA